MIKELSRPLEKDEIEFRIGMSKKEKGFSLLCYKTARTDTERLNDVCGMLWKPRFFYDEKKLLCCGISIYDKDIKEWIERVDVGTESNTEKEKGSYSDAFKRAGFKWGIGSELYNSPFIWVNWNDWYNGRPNFKPGNLEILEYVVKDNKIVKLEMAYSGKHIYSHGKNYIPETTPEERAEQEKQEKQRKEAEQKKKDDIGFYQAGIKEAFGELKNLGVAPKALQNSVKHHLGIALVSKCNDIEKLKAYLMHSQNKIEKIKNESKEEK